MENNESFATVVGSNVNVESDIELVKALTFRDKEQVRHNITDNQQAVYYNYAEEKSARAAVRPMPGSETIMVNNIERTRAIPISWLVNAFEVGSLRDFKNAYTGIVSVGLNIFQIKFDTCENTNRFLEKYENEKNMKGLLEDESFLLSAADFKEPIVGITMFPIPLDFNEERMRELVEDHLEIGKFENCFFGRHKHSQARNGFCNINIRTKLNDSDIPDRVYINKKCITILKGDKKQLYRPCPLCTMRNHMMPDCPAFHHFKDFAIEKKQKEEIAIKKREERENIIRLQIEADKERLLNHLKDQQPNDEILASSSAAGNNEELDKSLNLGPAKDDSFMESEEDSEEEYVDPRDTTMQHVSSSLDDVSTRSNVDLRGIHDPASVENLTLPDAVIKATAGKEKPVKVIKKIYKEKRRRKSRNHYKCSKICKKCYC